MIERMLDALKEQPVIAALRSWKDVERVARSQAGVVFMLGGEIGDVKRNITMLRKQAPDKIIFVHLDLVEGLGKDAKAVRFLAEFARPDGMLTTKNALIKPIKSHGMLAGQRCFMLDSQSYDMSVKSVAANKPHLVELMPGNMPRVISRFSADAKVPVIAGGFIETAGDVRAALEAGAVGISSSKAHLLEE